MRKEVQMYDILSATFKAVPGGFFQLLVPGLSECRPNVHVGDKVCHLSMSSAWFLAGLVCLGVKACCSLETECCLWRLLKLCPDYLALPILYFLETDLVCVDIGVCACSCLWHLVGRIAYSPAWHIVSKVSISSSCLSTKRWDRRRWTIYWNMIELWIRQKWWAHCVFLEGDFFVSSGPISLFYPFLSKYKYVCNSCKAEHIGWNRVI